MKNENIGFIYIAENKAMPNLYKIGHSGKEDLNERINGLFKTGVPLPFKCVYAGEIVNFKKVEEDIHDALADHRVHPKREFFKIKPELIIPWIERTFPTIKNVTEKVNKKIDEMTEDIDKKANEQYAKKIKASGKHSNNISRKNNAIKKEMSKRPQFDFKEMGIKPGKMITYIHDESKKAKIVNGKIVEYRNNEYNLAPLTTEFLGGNKGRILKHWKYKNKSLLELYDETYGKKV